MKKSMTLLVAAALALSVAGCAVQETDTTTMAAAETTTATETTAVQATTPETQATEPVPAVTEMTTAPAETDPIETEPVETEPLYPEFIERVIVLEGDEYPITMQLFDGGNYVIYYPVDEWEVYYDDEGAYPQDVLVSTVSSTTSLRIVNYGDMDLAEAEALIQEENSNYTFERQENGLWRGMDYPNRMMMEFCVISDGIETYGLQTDYFMEAAEGFGVRIRDMMYTFEIKAM